VTTRPSPDAIARERTAEGLRILARMIAVSYKHRLVGAEAAGTQLAGCSPARPGSRPPTSGKKKEISDNARG